MLKLEEILGMINSHAEDIRLQGREKTGYTEFVCLLEFQEGSAQYFLFLETKQKSGMAVPRLAYGYGIDETCGTAVNYRQDCEHPMGIAQAMEEMAPNINGMDGGSCCRLYLYRRAGNWTISQRRI